MSKLHFNSKAFLTLTATYCLFSFLVLPIIILQLNLVTKEINEQNFNNYELETVFCISFSLVFWVLPLIAAVGDKEVKSTIVKLLKSSCDDSEDFVYPVKTKT